MSKLKVDYCPKCSDVTSLVKQNSGWTCTVCKTFINSNVTLNDIYKEEFKKILDRLKGD